VVQICVPPRRIDLMSEVSGVAFDAAWSARRVCRVGDRDVPFLGLESLIQNKRATGRPKDQLDLALLERR
jgi:hypothetical protein